MEVKEYLDNCVEYVKTIDPTISTQTIEKFYSMFMDLDQPLNVIKNQIDSTVKTYIEAVKELTTSVREEEIHHELNELLDCRITGTTLHIHVVPNDVSGDIKRVGGVRAYIGYADNMLEDAFRKVYGILEDDVNIQTVFAVSPLLKADFLKELFIKRGFEVSMDVDQRFKDMFKNASKIGSATISRNKFMSEYQDKVFKTR